MRLYIWYSSCRLCANLCGFLTHFARLAHLLRGGAPEETLRWECGARSLRACGREVRGTRQRCRPCPGPPARAGDTAGPLGNAVTAMGRHGLGVGPPHLARGPRVCQHQPPQRLLAPGVDAKHRHAAPLGRAWDALSASGMTALSRLLAAHAAPRLSLLPAVAPLASRSCPGDGRDHRAEAPDTPVMPSPRGDRRAHRPALHPVLRARLVAPQAGRPCGMQPRSGKTRDTRAFTGRSWTHIAPHSAPLRACRLLSPPALATARHFIHENAIGGAECRVDDLLG
jgi:hypothetical protein